MMTLNTFGAGAIGAGLTRRASDPDRTPRIMLPTRHDVKRLGAQMIQERAFAASLPNLAQVPSVHTGLLSPDWATTLLGVSGLELKQNRAGDAATYERTSSWDNWSKPSKR